MQPAPAVTTASAATPAGVRRPAVAAALLGAAGVLYRLVLLVLHAPPSNSDEAAMGIAALRIAHGTGFPVFFYGQQYMGTFEAYLAAPLLALTGPSVLALRLPPLLLFAAFLVVMYRLAARLYRPWLAVSVVFLLALGSDRVVKNELIAAGGYPEIAPVGALLVLLAVGLAAGRYRRRAATFGLWGLLAGFCVWDDWLVLPYVAAAGVLLLAFAGRDLRGRAGLLLVAGVLVGAAPSIVADLTSPTTSFEAFLQLNRSAHAVPVADRLSGAVLTGMPLALGQCAPSRCAPGSGALGVAALCLLVAAAWLAVRGLRRAGDRVHGAPVGDAAPADRVRAAPGAVGDAAPADRVTQVGRLALAGAALVSIALYARSPAAGETPIESARYLHCVLISLPALLWPLWRLASRLRTRDSRAPASVDPLPAPPGPPARHAGAAVGAGLLALLVSVAVGGSVTLAGSVPAIGAEATDQRRLAASVAERGLTALYGEYSLCNRLAYASRERVACAVLRDDLTRGQDRLPGYRQRVAAAADPGYVFTAGSPADTAFRAWLRDLGVAARVVPAGRYRLYLPERPLPPPPS